MFASSALRHWNVSASGHEPKFKLTREQNFLALAQDFISERPFALCCQQVAAKPKSMSSFHWARAAASSPALLPSKRVTARA